MDPVMKSMIDAMSTMTAMPMPAATNFPMPTSIPPLSALPGVNMSDMGALNDMMGDMDMSCKISMLWNWYTINSCFIAKSWKITSSGMFAGSCIGVILLVVILEALRRLGREYDHFIVKRARLRYIYLSDSSSSSSNGHTNGANKQPESQKVPLSGTNGQNGQGEHGASDTDSITPVPQQSVNAKAPTPTAVAFKDTVPAPAQANFGPYRPSIVEQLVRALLHTVQFAVAYFIMLLAMYYNGYFIICIFIGAFIGSLIFSWEPVSLAKENDATAVTKCCG